MHGLFLHARLGECVQVSSLTSGDDKPMTLRASGFRVQEYAGNDDR